MQFRADEAAVVEKAVRLAVESVMNVLCAVNSARTNELQRLVADKERHIRKLEERVRETEGEVRLLRRWWSPSRAPEQSGADRERSGAEQERSGAEQRECDVRISLSLLSGPPQDSTAEGLEPEQTSSSKDHPVPQTLPRPPETPVQQPPSEGHAQQETSCQSDESVLQESQCPTVRQVKQEVLRPSPPPQIKQEPLCPDYVSHEDGASLFLQGDMREDVSPSVQDILGHSGLWQSVSPRAEDVPMSVHVPVSRPVTLSVPRGRDQSEEAMRRRRASWRAASRRYYARKMARLQTHHQTLHPTLHPTHGHTPGLRNSASLYPPCPGPRGNMHVQSLSQAHSSQTHNQTLNQTLNQTYNLPQNNQTLSQTHSSQALTQGWGLSSRGYASCEQALLQDPPRPPTHPHSS